MISDAERRTQIERIIEIFTARTGRPKAAVGPEVRRAAREALAIDAGAAIEPPNAIT